MTLKKFEYSFFVKCRFALVCFLFLVSGIVC